MGRLRADAAETHGRLSPRRKTQGVLASLQRDKQNSNHVCVCLHTWTPTLSYVHTFNVPIDLLIWKAAQRDSKVEDATMPMPSRTG